MPNKGKMGSGPGGRASALPREIDENLKRVYRERVEEGVPDRFLALLDSLRAKEATSTARDEDGTPPEDRAPHGGAR